MSENSIDIALVQETYLKPNRPKACSIAGYVQLRTDRTYSSKGGTALYYRRSLHCGPINIPPLTNMEATGCRLAMTGHSTLVIVSVYLPSPKRLLRRDLRALFALGDAVILFGDFNCKNINAYTNDVPRPSSSGVQLALFADDTALFYGNRNRSTRFTLLPLQRAIDELGQWFRKWRIEVNPDKSAAIQFKYGKIRSRLIVDKNTPNLKMLDAIIPWQRN
ncbi:RNA-directed DNA polymerase from mobile element jockey [Eumeta japonica]|uniref:RNA-directed DNA polymerase from mobile element jockey n=1 Tax=Eumeta variegata TaxID=151549 RepID=A0A4C1WRJ6_EUMVA|nr:RNA-directed DNA polymerase from mobile element jockey [Eumeta japonica]